jgi:hypothetical protein
VNILKTILLHPIATGFLVSIVLIPGTLSADILTVKQDGAGDFTVIQEAYLAASSGDTVLVFPGTYFENVHIYRSIDITMGSLFLITQDQTYVKNTVINGNQTGSCITIHNTGDISIIINGFIITNGSGYEDSERGGGIFISNCSPVIKNCIIEYCTAQTGGGIYMKYSEPFFAGNIIRYNHATEPGGGIFIAIDASPTFDQEHKNSIYLNHASHGCDICKTEYSPELTIFLDTVTVQNPDTYFILSYDDHGFPVNDIVVVAENHKVESVDAHLYVNPISGNNMNSGLVPDQPLKTIAFAMTKILPDTIDHNTIFLANGIYSPSLSGELLPVNTRSYVSLIGVNVDSTIIDAEYTSPLLYSENETCNTIIRNITFQNGNGDLGGISTFGGNYFISNSNIDISNLRIQYTISSLRPGIELLGVANLYANNIRVVNNFGGLAFYYGNKYMNGTCNINNCRVSFNGPDSNPFEGEGAGVGISGNIENQSMSYIVTNLNVTNNIRIPNPLWGTGQAVGLLIEDEAIVKLINCTVGNNVCRSENSFGINIDEGAEATFYNSILYGDSLREMSLGNVNGSFKPATANIAYSNIEGGESEIHNWYNQHTLNWLEGNINQNPQWVGTGDTAYYLQDDSPCINAGTPMYKDGMEPPYIREEDGKYVLYMHNMDTVHLPATDLAGNPRISGGRIDMGAYEYQDTTTAIAEFSETPENSLDVVVYPNPFYVHSFVDFSLNEKNHIQIIITDLNGKTVKNFLDATLPKGKYKFTWKGDNDYGTTLKTGVYLLTLWNGGEKISTVKIVKKRY